MNKPDETILNTIIERFLLEYKKNGNPIEVSFRNFLPNLKNSERATHLIHSYPAKLLMHIPYFFINNNIFSKPGDIVLDPFCGSGTVLLESILADRNAIGIDANPIARLISNVKTDIYDLNLLREISNNLKNSISNDSDFLQPNVINVNYWFLPHIQKQLTSILAAINKIDSEEYRNFFLVCFSNCVKKVSLTDPRVSVPVKLKKEQYSIGHPLRLKTEQKIESLNTMNVVEKFFEIVHSNIKRIDVQLSLRSPNSKAKVIGNDAKNIGVENEIIFKEVFNKNFVDLIITSPPYAGAQKYIRASSLNLGWLGYTSTNICLKKLEEKNIGREHYKKEVYSVLHKTNIDDADIILKKIYLINPLRSFIAANYLNEMRALSESVRLLKPDGYFILVAANNQVCGMEFKTQEFLMKIMQELGMSVVLKLIDDIKSYGLMTKRNKTASIITREWVLIFKKI